MNTTEKWAAPPNNITKQSFYDLFDNKIPYILIDDFLTSSECNKLVLAIQKMGLGQYEYNFDVNAAPPAQHLFETHYLYENKTPEEYFPKAKKSIEEYLSLCNDIQLYPHNKLMTYLEKTIQKPAKIATQDGHQYSYIIIRELKKSALLHADFAAFIPGYWSISNVVAQYAWNIYLTDPGVGGQCVVYNKPWEKDDDKFIVGDTYGYNHEVVKNKEHVEVSPKPGRLLMFNSRNFHEVKSSENIRMGIGGHIGLTSTGEIILWV